MCLLYGSTKSLSLSLSLNQKRIFSISLIISLSNNTVSQERERFTQPLINLLIKAHWSVRLISHPSTVSDECKQVRSRMTAPHWFSTL
jgi:hypothetical protein